jgi:hydroxyacylglutathione hydrolase
MKLIALPAFSDNYLWLWQQDQQAVVVDPGDAAPVLQALRAHGLTLAAILVTHHHADHVGGVQTLRDATGAEVWGPAREDIPGPFTPVMAGDTLHLLGQRVQVLDVPGHTRGHVAYVLPDAPEAPVLFSGDTLFSGGCGRIFEGTPAQMLASLDSLAALPPDTRVCCAHEYTLSNVRFALDVEPTWRTANNCANKGKPPCPRIWAPNCKSTRFYGLDTRMCDMLSLNTQGLPPPHKTTMWLCLPPCANGRTLSNEIFSQCFKPRAGFTQRLCQPLCPEYRRRRQLTWTQPHPQRQCSP